LSDAISISGYIPTSGDITVRTIEKLDLENMGIAAGILIIGATELRDTRGGVILPPPHPPPHPTPRWTSEGAKIPWTSGVNITALLPVHAMPVSERGNSYQVISRKAGVYDC